MRVRAQDANGDSTFGASQANFLVNTPEAVAQTVTTRLRLLTDEWFLDVTAGTPWQPDVIGVRTRPTQDRTIRARITGTPNVNSILDYSSQSAGRALDVATQLDTAFGVTAVIVPSVGAPITIPPPPPAGGQLDFSDPDNSGFLGSI